MNLYWVRKAKQHGIQIGLNGNLINGGEIVKEPPTPVEINRVKPRASS